MAINAMGAATLLRAGSGLTIRGDRYTALELNNLARIAHDQGAHLTIMGTGILSELDVQGIAGAGKSNVTIDLSQ